MAKGYVESKTKRIINGLVGKGVLKAINTRPIQYKVNVEYPNDPSLLNAVRKVFTVTDYLEQSGQIIEPKIEPALVSRAIENYWVAVKIDDIATIYYPFYGIWYEREDGSTRLEAIDGISGKLNEHIASTLAR